MKLADAPVELRQLLPGVSIVGVIAHLHQRLAHTLQRQCQRVVDQARHLHAMPLQHDQVELGVVRNKDALSCEAT
mgnify:CR=1 FL=1